MKRATKSKADFQKGETDECLGREKGRRGLDEFTPGLWVSQGTSMQGMLPDSPWYWLVSEAWELSDSPPFALSAGSRLGVCGWGKRC